MEIFENHTASLTCLKSNQQLRKKHNLANLKSYRESKEDVKKVEDDTTEESEIEEKQTKADSLEETSGDYWIKRLALKFKHKNLIQDSNGELDYTIIDAALKLLKEQFPNINGLESPLLQSNSKGSVNLRPPIVQIHHDENRQHWIVSSAICGKLEICDFLRQKKVSDFLTRVTFSSQGCKTLDLRILQF